MRLRIVFVRTRLVLLLLFIRSSSAGSLRLCCFGDQKPLADLQFVWIVNMIERD